MREHEEGSEREECSIYGLCETALWISVIGRFITHGSVRMVLEAEVRETKFIDNVWKLIVYATLGKTFEIAETTANVFP